MPARRKDAKVIRSDVTEYTMAEWRRLRLKWLGAGVVLCLLVEAAGLFVLASGW